MGAQPCKHIKSHCVVPFEWLNCVVYELYLNKVIKKKRKATTGKSLFSRHVLILRALLLSPLCGSWIPGFMLLSLMLHSCCLIWNPPSFFFLNWAQLFTWLWSSACSLHFGKSASLGWEIPLPSLALWNLISRLPVILHSGWGIQQRWTLNPLHQWLFFTRRS